MITMWIIGILGVIAMAIFALYHSLDRIEDVLGLFCITMTFLLIEILRTLRENK